MKKIKPLPDAPGIPFITKRRRSPSLLGGLIGVVLCTGIASTGHAALVEITVQGTWETASGNATINPFGILVNDTFTMHAIYDDTTLFNGGDGVTAAIDPTVEAGTMFEVMIPHSAGAPNPLVFTHADHADIGFGSFAQIKFDGTDATSDPGVFRNFEFFVEFAFGGQDFELALFSSSGEPISEMINADQGLATVADSIGGDHLEIVAPVVPIPAAAWLFGSALGGLGWMRRRPTC